jgi:hypothetical protein
MSPLKKFLTHLVCTGARAAALAGACRREVDESPLGMSCACRTCTNFSRAYYLSPRPLQRDAQPDARKHPQL